MGHWPEPVEQRETSSVSCQGQNLLLDFVAFGHRICFFQHLDVLTGGSKSVRFFLPLCGKAGDLLYLYNEGHTVTGVEGVPYVVEQFFRENKLDYEKVSMPEVKGWKFKVNIAEAKSRY